MKKIAIAVLLFSGLAACVLTESRQERQQREAYQACLKWATTHVYTDGKTVADDVDPRAWCQP